MLGEARVGTALLTLQLRAAVQEAVQAEASFGDRDIARDELRGRLAVLVDRRRTDLAAELTAARVEADRLVEEARERAAAMVESSASMARPEPIPVEVVVPAVAPAVAAAPGLTGRARGALLARQLRTALQEAADAERDEALAREANAKWQPQTLSVDDRRRELDDALTLARGEAAAQIRAARTQAEALIAAAQTVDLETEVVWSDVVEPAVVEPAVVERAVDIEPEVVEQSVAEPLQAEPAVVLPVLAPAASPAVTTPVNVVIDAEAFARVFAAVFATMFDERVAAWGGTPPAAQYPTQMYGVGQFALPQPAPAPVKQSFWSHAKHVDVLLLSAAMVIVLVVLAAWLV